jgi:sigma-E factor negative regulatory protein RseA
MVTQEKIMKPQDSELSALYDGELETHESRAALDAALRNPSATADWHAYAMIGDHLRQQDGWPACDMTAAVMARLQSEPVVLAPANLQLRSQRHPVWALAASVAGVGVVGWLAFVGAPGNESRSVATVSPASTLALVSQPKDAVLAARNVETASARRDMQEYLLAHHTQAATFRLGDSTEHVRSVAMTGLAARP